MQACMLTATYGSLTLKASPQVTSASSTQSIDQSINQSINQSTRPTDSANQMGQTALHIAALWGNVEAMEVLLELGCDASIRNSR